MVRAGIAEPQSVAFDNNDKPAANQRQLDLGHLAVTSVKPSWRDKFLERTLVDNIEISERLSRCESEILKLVFAGKTNKEMARMLCRSQRTIEYHRNRLMRKLGVNNAVDLVKRAIAAGIT